MHYYQGRAIFASGSPFAPVEYEGKEFVPGQVLKPLRICITVKNLTCKIRSNLDVFFVCSSQANNAYIFPGFGLGLIMSGTIRVHDDLLLAACKCTRLGTLISMICFGYVEMGVTGWAGMRYELMLQCIFVSFFHSHIISAN